MSPIGGPGSQVEEQSGSAPLTVQADPSQPMAGLGWFFRTPFFTDWLFWVGVAFVVSSLIPPGTYLTLMVTVLVPYWTLGALVSRRRRQGRPPVRRLRTRGWGLDAWCATFTAFAAGYGLFLVLETVWFALRVHG